MFDNMGHSQWDRTIRSKVWTSWNLHTMLPQDMDFFILLSSISGVIGNPGQSNYSAGCTFQDSLAQYRTHNGQKALSIDIGVLTDVGVVAESDHLRKKLTSDLRLSRMVSEGELLSLMDLCCDPREASLLPAQVTLGLATPNTTLEEGLEKPEFMKSPLFLTQNVISGGVEAGKSDNYSTLFRQAESAEDRASIVFQSLANKLARALAINPEDIDENLALHLFGVDSLVAMELKNWIAKEFLADVAVYELMGGRSVAAICELVTKMTQIQIKDKEASGREEE